MKIIFLDIDGPLNMHIFDRVAGCCGIERKCVRELNRIIKATDAKIVLSSAWRYMIHGGAMTSSGFEYMLRTHGACTDLKIIGLTCRDEELKTRGLQIQNWIDRHRHLKIKKYVVIDDDAFDIAHCRHPLVKVGSKIGLTRWKANQAIAILNS
jgi:hypothetical protein